MTPNLSESCLVISTNIIPYEGLKQGEIQNDPSRFETISTNIIPYEGLKR